MLTFILRCNGYYNPFISLIKNFPHYSLPNVSITTCN